MTCIDVQDWDPLCRAFLRFFHGLGSVETDDHRAVFRSEDASLCTSLSIARDGRFAAAMPLHELSLIAVAVELDCHRAEIRLLGEGGASYTYRVPPQLLARRPSGRVLPFNARRGSGR